MESVAVSLLGTTELMFIEPGVKINGIYYRDVLLGQHLLPAIRSVAEDFFTHNAPAHRAADTITISEAFRELGPPLRQIWSGKSYWELSCPEIHLW